VLNPDVSRTYASSASASIGQVLDAEVYYYNLEFGDSGDDARSMLVSINASSDPGSGEIQATAGGSNTNQLELVASYSIPPTAILKFIPGSGRWKHNPTQGDRHAHFLTTPLSNEITQAGIDLGNAAPCIACDAIVVVQFRVVDAAAQ
jgi:hypothetical protein